MRIHRHCWHPWRAAEEHHGRECCRCGRWQQRLTSAYLGPYGEEWEEDYWSRSHGRFSRQVHREIYRPEGGSPDG